MKCAWHGVTAMWETNNRQKYGSPTLLGASQTAGHASVYTLTALCSALLLASPAICCYPATVDRHSDDYVTMFHLAGCLLMTCSHALVIQTMGLHGLCMHVPELTTGYHKLNTSSEYWKTEF